MSLTNLHTITTHQDYVLLRDHEIKLAEDDKLLAGTDLRSLGPREDILANSAFIGYGIDFRKNSIADIRRGTRRPTSLGSSRRMTSPCWQIIKPTQRQRICRRYSIPLRICRMNRLLRGY